MNGNPAAAVRRRARNQEPARSPNAARKAPVCRRGRSPRAADNDKGKAACPTRGKVPACHKPCGPLPAPDRVKAASPQRPAAAARARAPAKIKAGKGAPHSPERVLQSTLESLKIRKKARGDVAGEVNKIVEGIIKHLKTKSDCFSEIEKLPTGSYYENVKISEPNEFDVMLTVPVQRVELQEFDSEGAFYSVSFKRNPQKRPLDRFVLNDRTISANKMLKDFRNHIKQATASVSSVKLERKKAGCPAVTLLMKVKGREVGLDIVLGLKVHAQSWPTITKDGFNIDGWLGTKVKQEFKRCPFYLVPKYVGKGTDEKHGVCAKDTWRISFSHVEKGILKNHGFAKTCCESGGSQCCRKQCLKLLKCLLQKLKEKHPELAKFFSYQAKTALLHACVKRPQDSDWEIKELDDCFQQFLDDFIQYLKAGDLPHFFIPTYNLLYSTTKSHRQFLIKCIEEQRNNRFPVFRN